MTGEFLEIARAKVGQDKFEISQHAQEEAALEQIGVDDIKHATPRISLSTTHYLPAYCSCQSGKIHLPGGEP